MALSLEELVQKTAIYKRVCCKESKHTINMIRMLGLSTGRLKKHLRGDKIIIGEGYETQLDPCLLTDYVIIGLFNELGELAEKIQAGDLDGARGELADVYWYLTAAAGELGCSLQHLENHLMDKLLGRLSRGTIQGDGDKR